MENFNLTTLIAGGLATSALGEYTGIHNPVLVTLAATMGGLLLSRAQSAYNKYKNLLSPVMSLNETLDRLQWKIGLKFFTVVVDKYESVIYNKLEAYIIHRYADSMVSGNLGNGTHSKLSISLDGNTFSHPIVDHHEGHRMYLSIHENRIYIQSKTLKIEEIKTYIHSVMAMRLGIRTITVHQPTIQTTIKSSGKRRRNEDEFTGDNGNNISVSWNAYKVHTNKNFSNTILKDSVKKEFLDDLKYFLENEDYYNTKGIPYKRGYLLYGMPGGGKSSLIKAIAAHYGMDVFLINMGEIQSEKELSLVFQGTRTCSGYHILCFEDIDRCTFLQRDRYERELTNSNMSMVRSLLNELDGIVEVPNRVTILTVNDKTVIENIPALVRPGRIDKSIHLDYCDCQQLNKLFNHYTDSGEELHLQDLSHQITPAQAVKYILANPKLSPEEFKIKLDEIHKIVVEERNLSSTVRQRGMRKTIRNRNPKLAKLQKEKRKLSSLEKDLKALPNRLKRSREMLKKRQEIWKKEKEKNKQRKLKEKSRVDCLKAKKRIQRKKRM